MLKKSTVEKQSSTKTSVSRGIFAAVSIIMEALVIMFLATRFYLYAEWVALGTRLLSFVLVLLIYSRYQTPSLKTLWIILILIVPIVGVTMYLIVGFASTPRAMQRRFESIDRILSSYIPRDPEAAKEAAQYDPHLANISEYLTRHAGYPLWADLQVTYYPDSTLGLQAQLDAMQKAEKFIFMEYHAIENAESWMIIRDILIAKVKSGVEVRIFYDDVGSIGFLSPSFRKQLEEIGIQCRIFNPIVPFLKMFLNNRDHRKITIVDGTIAFTGGYNIANEYFNLTHPYGHWKDAGLKVTGSAARNMTAMFLEMWNAIKSSDVDDQDFDRYFPEITPAPAEDGAHAFIQPYADIPTDSEQVGENVYIAMIEQAVDYVYFSTPYLIITDEMIHAMGLAAKKGVDVRIITPGIPDKKIVYHVTRSYYHGLVRCGVRIFEYTPGFCHSKLCVVDGKAAICGTINLDYRSLYHHFEDAVLFYNTPAVAAVKADFDNTFPLCQEVTEQYNTGRSHSLRFAQIVLRLFAPLL